MIKTFIIHVSKGYEDRRKHIDTHLLKRGISEYEYMLRGDIDDLSDEVRNEFFGSELSLAEKSCFYKHYLVMKEVVNRKIPQVLVLEDDAILDKFFSNHLGRILEELRNENNYIINIEEASSQVPFSIRKKGVSLYLSEINKLAGGLVYDYQFAKKMVHYLENNRNEQPIDTTIGKIRHSVGFNLYWTHPTLVKQGSKSGLFNSDLSGRRAGFYTAFRALFKDFYKKYLLSNVKKSHKSHFLNVRKY